MKGIRQFLFKHRKLGRDKEKDDCIQSNTTIMNRGEFIPIDILLEIFSRLSAKSIARCRCVSKFWTSILSRTDFKELFLTKSSTRPRLLFALKSPNNELHFYSLPQPNNLYKKSSSYIPSADIHMKFYVDRTWPHICGPVSGLIYLPNVRFSKEDEDTFPVICNLSTGKYVRLPQPGDMGLSFFVYDPIEKQFKVLFISCSDKQRHQILTLGSENVAWRTIQVPLRHFPSGWTGRVSINGVLYYLAYQDNIKIFCFDFRSETFMCLDKEFSYDDLPMKLIKYKGKLGAIIWCWRFNPHEKYNFEMSLFVLEDVEKQEWSKHDYTLWNDTDASFHVTVVGVTTTGEFVLSKDYISEPFINPFDVFYFNPEKNSLQSIRIPGSGANLEALEDGTRVVYTSIDYVEDLKFI